MSEHSTDLMSQYLGVCLLVGYLYLFSYLFWCCFI